MLGCTAVVTGSGPPFNSILCKPHDSVNSDVSVAESWLLVGELPSWGQNWVQACQENWPQDLGRETKLGGSLGV